MRLLIILSVLFSPLSFAGHHSDSKDNQIIFLLDLEVIEGKQSQVNDLQIIHLTLLAFNHLKI